MKTDHMVGSRRPEELIRDLEMIEKIEQTDRSTTVRKLLYKAVSEWKLDHFAHSRLWGKCPLPKQRKRQGHLYGKYVRHQKLPAQYDADDLKKDINTVLAKRKS